MLSENQPFHRQDVIATCHFNLPGSIAEVLGKKLLDVFVVSNKSNQWQPKGLSLATVLSYHITSGAPHHTG